MQESHFHTIADRWLQAAQDRLEDADREGLLDIDYTPGALTIQLDSGETYVVSKHAASRQMWLSSPISGGLHFAPDDAGGWLLPDGRDLATLLAGELQRLSGLTVRL